jgi:hypothetical protein
MSFWSPRTSVRAALLLAIFHLTNVVSAQDADPTKFKCARGDAASLSTSTPTLGTCTATDLAASNLFHVLVLSTGYAASERDAFFSDAARIIRLASYPGDRSNTPQWLSERHKARFLYIAGFLPGGVLGASDARFGASIEANAPRRLFVDVRKVYSEVSTVDTALARRGRPSTVIALYNTAVATRANALPPQLTERGYGIVKVQKNPALYTVAHELGHGFAGWLDEYAEQLPEISTACDMDGLTWTLWDYSGRMGLLSWFPDFENVYPLKLSQIYIAGSDNVSPSACPTRVGPLASYGPAPGTCSTSVPQAVPGCPEFYGRQGAAFFAAGAYRQAATSGNGDTPMSSGTVHSPSQERVMATIFGGTGPQRRNDRIRTVGPVGAVSEIDFRGTGFTSGAFAGRPVLLGFDEDKHNPWQPTKTYHVEIREVGSTATPTRLEFAPQEYYVTLENSLAWGPLDWTTGGLLRGILPPRVRIPYQMFELPYITSDRTYQWRFRTGNRVGGCALSCSEGSTATTCNACSYWTKWTDASSTFRYDWL